MNRNEMARNLYTAYCAAVGGVAFNGDPLPIWEVFFNDTSKKKQADAWLEAADAAIAMAEARYCN